ncbi:MAG: hypothetical protein WCG25_03770 [bacterium]
MSDFNKLNDAPKEIKKTATSIIIVFFLSLGDSFQFLSTHQILLLLSSITCLFLIIMFVSKDLLDLIYVSSI